MLKKIPLSKQSIFLLALSIGLSFFTARFGHMNNWLIFRASFFHLLDGTSLYQLYPGEHNDLFKYSPSFALLMAPLSILPAWLGAVLWNLFGASLFIFALSKLPLKDNHKRGVFWICLPEFIGSTQGFQSNIHMVALLVLFWVYLEEKKVLLSTSNLLGSFFIKIFGVLGGCLYIFSDYSFKNWRFFLKSMGSLVLLFIGISLLPALFVGMESLRFQYIEWLKMLQMDASQSYGFSLMGVIHGFTGLEFDRLPFQIAGGISLLLSFFISRNGNQQARLLGLIALCYFLILFNHKSESPTFIIAMFAFGIHQALIVDQKMRWTLIIVTLGCVSLMYSDLFRHIKQSHLDVYSVKVWPFLILYPMALCHWCVAKKQSLSNKI